MTQLAHSDPMHLHLRVEQIDGYEFRVRFDDDRWRDLVVDEPAPLGRDAGPNSARVLGAAIADCLCASLLFCMQRSGVTVGPIDADVVVDLARNDEHRLRIPRVRVTLRPTVAGGGDKVDACLAAFQDYCVVTQSVRQGIDIQVTVEPFVDGVEGPTA